MPKEEEKLDPMAPMLELLGSLSPDERLYIQFIITPFRKESFKHGQLRMSEGEGWEKTVERKVNELMKRDKGDEDMTEEINRLSPGERSKIEAVERNGEKYAYHTVIRYMYFAKKGKFNGDLISQTNRTFSQYDVMGRNKIGIWWRTDANYAKIIPGSRKHISKLKVLEHIGYKLRDYDYRNQFDHHRIFSTEELATMFHLPGQVVFNPNLARVNSLRGEAPTNLPTS